MSDKHCSVCNMAFSCTVGQGACCWCNALPPIMPADFAQDCRCPACLSLAIATHIQTFIQSNSLAKIIKIAQPYGNDNALIEYIDYTIEQGNTVFSAWYHLKRGFCCHHGCRHCPYQKSTVLPPATEP